MSTADDDMETNRRCASASVRAAAATALLSLASACARNDENFTHETVGSLRNLCADSSRLIPGRASRACSSASTMRIALSVFEVYSVRLLAHGKTRSVSFTKTLRAGRRKARGTAQGDSENSGKECNAWENKIEMSRLKTDRNKNKFEENEMREELQATAPGRCSAAKISDVCWIRMTHCLHRSAFGHAGLPHDGARRGVCAGGQRHAKRVSSTRSKQSAKKVLGRFQMTTP